MTLVEFVHGQRWFGAKSQEVTDAQIVDECVLRAEPRLRDALVELRYGDGNHDLYQLLLGDDVDVIGEPTTGTELVRLLQRGATLPTRDGQITFDPYAFAPFPKVPLESSHTLGVEQSNSSLVVDDRVFLKVYRRIEAGENPDLELTRFLVAHGFENVPMIYGSWSYAGPLLGATLGIAQEFVPGSVDGWSLALDELSSRPDEFLARVDRLGHVVGELHATLSSVTDDPAFCPEEPTQESLALLTAEVDEDIEQVFLHLPELDTVAPIAGRGDMVRDLLRSLTSVGAVGRRIRHHGDLHLGQVLWARGDWLVIDFEGEPARPLPDRRTKRSPLRDVAGMLRSFTYAASVAGVAGTGVEERARTAFLESYLDVMAGTGLLPAPETTDRLLRTFELEKAVYELRYELAHRPDWVPVPVAGIIRLLEGAA
ncbi:MAG TPA: phosphotransferase [Gaiellaceae bacterium]|jgi:trehalose synthase-fused probable maltokinase